jgi:hypothetical protein
MIIFGFILFMDDQAIKRLLNLIEEQLEWGKPERWASRDFEELNVLIQKKTKVSLSSSTLRRLWGKAAYQNQPSLTTLDTLAQFSGFESWKAYCVSGQHKLPPNKPEKPFVIKPRWVIAAIAIILVVLGLSASFFLMRTETTAGNYIFTSKPIMHDLPNTVVFSYDVHLASTDSVFIQQTWDSTKKVRVNKNKHVFNSIYYKPGFYNAKLTVGTHVVKEHQLLIPTNGWLGLIDQKPIPVYLDKEEFVTDSGLRVTPSTITKHHLSLEPQPPSVEFYNTGNFEPISMHDFSFSTEIKNDYRTGASRCQQITILLYTNNIPILIPLSEPGCIASLNLLDGKNEFKGSNTNLSGFGLDLTNWVKVMLISNNGKIDIFVNGKSVFIINNVDKSARILGLGFLFRGTGSIRRVALKSGKRSVFNAFN